MRSGTGWRDNAVRDLDALPGVANFLQVRRMDQQSGNQKLTSAIHWGDLLPGATYLSAKAVRKGHHFRKK